MLFYFFTFLLGMAFFFMQIGEFVYFASQGHRWDQSAFLSAYFTLLGTHACHVFFGLLWMVVFLIPVIKEGINPTAVRRLTCLRMFWQFLNVIWVFIFTFVYLMGVD